MEPTTRASAKTRLVNLGIHEWEQQEGCLCDPCGGGRFPIRRLLISWAWADRMCFTVQIFCVALSVGHVLDDHA